MFDLFSDDARRDPFPLYEQARRVAPVFREPRSGIWMVFDYEGVRRVLTEHEAFSSRHGPDWMNFSDPPRHSKLRALVSKAFTPRSIVNLEPRIRELSRGLLDRVVGRGGMDVAADLAVPLPMLVIAEMLGIPPADRERFVRWNDVLLDMGQAVVGSPETGAVVGRYTAATAEMSDYLIGLLAERQSAPKDDLLTRLLAADVDGQRLTHEEILGFFQLLLLAGSETTTNLINNAVLCFMDYPDQLARVRERPGVVPTAIEEVLRYRSPLQWMYRVTRRDVELHGRTVPAGEMVLAMIGSANHDPGVFAEPGHFDVGREPNPHLAFGHGVHFCLGAPLARLEAKIALGDFLERVQDFWPATGEPWEPRTGLHVHGPARLPIVFREKARR